MVQEKETPYDAILRLQKKVDQINGQIILKQQRLASRRIGGPLANLIADEIIALNTVRDSVIRNISQLMKVKHETI